MIIDFQFQYANWPIYPFTIYLKSCITEIQDYFINIQKQRENYRNGKENVQDARI